MRNCCRALALGLIVAASPAVAQDPVYRATLHEPPSRPRYLTSDMIWRCRETVCSARQGHSRPLIDCGRLARMAGRILTFEIGKKVLSEDQLRTCNRDAKKPKTP